MTKYYSVNKEYDAGEGDIAIYDLVNVLTASGWTIQSASNGTNFAAGTTYWSSASWGNLAWVTVREPSGPGGREWCFQRVTYDYNWRVKVSPYAGFSGGSPSATQVPSATDEGIIWGSGDDATPTGAQLFYTSNRFKFHAIAESTPVGPVGNQAYGFWSFHNLAGAMGDYGYGFIGQEPLAVGSYPALTGSRVNTTSGEADPCIYGCYYNGNANYAFGFFLHGFNEDVNTGAVFKYFYKYQNASGSVVNAYDLGGVGSSNYGWPRFVNVHPCSGEDVNFPFMVGRYAGGTSQYYTPVFTNVGLKGTCNFLKIRGTNRSTGVPVNLSTDAYVYVGDLVMPWPENIVPEL